MMLVSTETSHVSNVPPAMPELLHWLILIGMAGLTVDAVATAQSAVEPPPVTESLHWTTVAVDGSVVAGNGSHTSNCMLP
jgi:hypothetical protein